MPIWINVQPGSFFVHMRSVFLCRVGWNFVRHMGVKAADISYCFFQSRTKASHSTSISQGKETAWRDGDDAEGCLTDGLLSFRSLLIESGALSPLPKINLLELRSRASHSILIPRATVSCFALDLRTRYCTALVCARFPEHGNLYVSVLISTSRT